MSVNPNEIEGDSETPEQWTYPRREKRKDGQNAGREVAVGGEAWRNQRASWTDDTRKKKDKPEETKTVQSRDCPLCLTRSNDLGLGRIYVVKTK